MPQDSSRHTLPIHIMTWCRHDKRNEIPIKHRERKSQTVLTCGLHKPLNVLSCNLSSHFKISFSRVATPKKRFVFLPRSQEGAMSLFRLIKNSLYTLGSGEVSSD